VNILEPAKTVHFKGVFTKEGDDYAYDVDILITALISTIITLVVCSLIFAERKVFSTFMISLKLYF
jgi:hypothetical protein